LSKKTEFSSDTLSEDSTFESVRAVVNRSPHRSVGILACSWIQDHGIEYESQLERRFLHQTLVLSGIKRIIHQPFRLEYLEDGKTHTYVPDFLIHFADGRKAVVEVKPKKFINGHRHKLEEAERILAEKNVPFLVITDVEIDDGIKAANASYLLRFARGSASEQTKQNCLRALRISGRGLSLENLIRQANVSEAEILHFVGRGALSLDLSEPIVGTTIVFIPQEDNKNDYLHFVNWFNTAPGTAIARIPKDAKRQ
jgi:hypothetical protein